MLERNYRDWREYVERLLNIRFTEELDSSEELNRLILNYLTFAYSVIQHFEVSFKQRFRGNAAKLREYKGFLDSLCASSWPFSFVLDFRGYVQHVGLAVGDYNRHVGMNVVRVKVTADAKTLIVESRDWRRSKLSGSHGKIDLIKTLRDFHVQMLQNYGRYVAKTFFPELKEASRFYRALAVEATQGNRGCRMVFIVRHKETAEPGKTSIEVKVEEAPNDVFREVGIRIS